MANVDQRIVEMKFENHLFEANANKSIGTLERLKQALNFNGAEKSFNNIEKSVGKMDLSPLANSIDQINNRFSAMGIAGMTVISNLTTAAMNFGKQAVNNIIEPIKTGGWNRASNIAAAKFQIEGLGRTWDEVKDDIDYGVKDTAYGLDAAAKVASQLLASGVEVGDQMKADLRAISGVAAMTNSTYEDIGSIFTTVAGNGKLMTYQLNQLAFRGLNVAAELGKQLGKTEAEIREMTTKGEISFSQFAKAMDDAYGDHAKAANKTFTGSMANMRAALSRIGAEFATPFQDSMISVYNAARKVIDVFKKEKLPPIFEDFTDFIGKATGFATHILQNLDLSWVDNLVSKLHSAYQAFDTLMTAINPFWKKVEDDAENTKENVEKTAADIDEIVQGVLRGEYGNGEERKKALEDLGYYYKQVQNKVNEALGNTFRYDLDDEKLMENTKKLGDNASEAARNLHELRIQQIDLRDTASDLKKTFESTFDDTWLLSKVDKFKAMGNGLKSVFAIAANTINAVVKGAQGPLTRIAVTLADTFIDAGAGIGNWLTDVGNYLQESGFFIKVQEKVNDVFTVFADIIEDADGFARKGIDYLSKGFNKLEPIVNEVKKSVNDFFESFKNTKGYQRIKTFAQNVEKSFNNIKKTIQEAIEDWLGKKITLPKIDTKGWAQKASDAIEFVLDKVDAAKNAVTGFFSKHFTSENSIFKPITDFFSNLTWENSGEKLVNLLSNIKDSVVDFFNRFTSGSIKGFEDFGRSIGEFFTNIKDGIQNFSIDDIKGAFDKIKDIFFDIVFGLTKLNFIRAVNGFLNMFWQVPGLIEDIRTSILHFSGATDFSEKFLNIGKAIAFVAGSLFLLAQLDTGQLVKGAIAVGAIAAALGVLYAVINRLGKSTTGSGNPLIDAVKNIINNFKFILQPFLNKVGFAAMVAAFAVAVSTLTGVIMDLLDVPWGKAKNSLKIMAGIFAELGIAMAAASWLANPRTSIGNAAFLLALAYTVKILAGVTKDLGDVDPSKIEQGMLAIGEIFAGVAAIELGAGLGKGGTGKLVAMIFLIAEIAGAMTLLITLPTEKIQAATNTITSILNSLALLVFASGKMLKGKGIGQTIANFGMLSILIGVIAFALSKLKDIDATQAKGISKAISGLIKGFAWLVLAMSMFKGMKLPDVGSILAGIAGIVAVITAIVAVLGAIEKLTKGGFSNLLSKAIEPITMLGEAIGKFIGGILNYGVIGPLSNLGGNFMDGVTSFFNGIRDFINDAKNLDPAGLDNVIELTLKLAAANFTSGLAAISSGVFGSHSISEMGEQLVEFGKSMRKFSNEITKGNGIDSTAVEAAANAGMMLTALAQSVPNTKQNGEFNLASFLLGDNDVDVWGAKLPALAEGLKGFSDKLGNGINTDAVEAAASAGEMLAALSNNIPNTKQGDNFNVLSFLVGDNDIDVWASKLPALAEGLSGFAEKLPAEGFDENAVKSATSVAGMLAAFSETVPNSGGVLGWLVGENDIDTWAEKLPKLAEGLSDYAEKLPDDGFDENAVEQSTRMGELLTSLAKTVPDSGGKLAEWFGDNSLDNFGGQLEGFATGLVTFANTIEGTDFTKAYSVVGSFTRLVSTFSQLRELDNSLDESLQLDSENILRSLSTLFDNLGANFDKFSFSETSTEAFKNIGSKIVESISEGVSGATGEVSGGFLGFGKKSGGENPIVKAIGDSLLQNVSTETLTQSAQEFGQKILDEIGKSISLEEGNTDMSEKLKTAVQGAFDDAANVIPESQGNFTEKAQEVITAVAGIISANYEVPAAVRAACFVAYSQIAAFRGAFESAGLNLMAGLAAGIQAGTAQVVAAIASAVSAANAEMAKLNQIKSPSRLYRKFGLYMMEGWAIGIDDGTNMPVKSINKSARTIISIMEKNVSNVSDRTGSAVQNIMGSVKGAYSYINSVLADGLDSAPRITPVLDLSNIQNGVNSLNGMWGSGFENSLSYARTLNPYFNLKDAQVDPSSNMIDVITGIRQDITDLGNAITGMKMVMDSGAVVGSISGGMDRSLGQIQKFNERWA